MADEWDEFPDYIPPKQAIDPASDPWAEFPDAESYQAIPSVEKKPKGLFGQISQDIKDRSVMAGDIVGMGNGRVTDPRIAIPLAGKVGFGLLGDVTGDVASSAYRAVRDLNPNVQTIDRLGRKVLSAAANSGPGQSALGAVENVTNAIGEKYGDFQKQKPLLSANIEGAAGIAGWLLPVGGRPAAAVALSAPKATLGLVKKSTDDAIRAITSPKVTADMVKKEANKAYKFAEDAGGVLSPEARNSFLDEINKLTPQTEDEILLAGQSDFTKVIDALNIRRDKPLTLEQAQGIDEQLGDFIDSNLHPNGKPTKIGKRIMDIQDTLRSYVREPDEKYLIGGKEGFDAWREGQRLWQKQIQLRDIEKILTRAEMYDNPATAIKTGFRTLANNEKRMRGYDAHTRELIKNAAESGIVSDALKTAGSRLNPIAAFATHGPVGGAAVGVLSGASRNAATRLQAGRANKVVKNIARDYKFKVPEKGGPK